MEGQHLRSQPVGDIAGIQSLQVVVAPLLFFFFLAESCCLHSGFVEMLPKQNRKMNGLTLG